MIDPTALAVHPNFGGFAPKFGTVISDFGGLVRESGRAVGGYTPPKSLQYLTLFVYICLVCHKVLWCIKLTH